MIYFVVMKNSCLSFVLIVVFLVSCSRQIPFDKEEWDTKDDIFYNHREFMIEDLQNNYLISGMKYKDVAELLGQKGEYHDSIYVQLKYDIYTDYGWDIDPVETKTFVINFLPDSTYVSSEIYHWKKK